jgi:hypothetical protein
MHGWGLPVIIINDHADGEPFRCHSPSALLVFPATVWCISNYPFLRCNTPYYVVGRPFPSSYERIMPQRSRSVALICANDPLLQSSSRLVSGVGIPFPGK